MHGGRGNANLTRGTLNQQRASALPHALGGETRFAGSAGEVDSGGSEVVLKQLGSVVLHLQNAGVEELRGQRLGQRRGTALPMMTWTSVRVSS